MLSKEDSDVKYSGPYEVVGRDPRIDLRRYTVTVCGRELIDYEKLMRDEPQLYKDIVANAQIQDLCSEDV